MADTPKTALTTDQAQDDDPFQHCEPRHRRMIGSLPAARVEKHTGALKDMAIIVWLGEQPPEGTLLYTASQQRERDVLALRRLRNVMARWHSQAVAAGFDGVADALDSLSASPVAMQPKDKEQAVAPHAVEAQEQKLFPCIDLSSCIDGDLCAVVSLSERECGEYVYRSSQPIVYEALERIASRKASANSGACACRWDADDKRIQTCERHQGWLDVISEWADRARTAEAALKESK